MHIVLFEPEIPPNTGNIIRLCANTGSQLHLIHPLGFKLEDKLLRRAGLDYHEWANVREHASLQGFIDGVEFHRLYAFSTRGTKLYADIAYCADDALLFGPETRGLPRSLLHNMPRGHVARLPMKEHSRSLNLSNSVSIVVYEAWRQLGFE